MTDTKSATSVSSISNKLAREQQRVLVIGDIHGHIHRIRSLWATITKSFGSELDDFLVVFLGDYVDRGRKSADVLDFLIEIKQKRPQTIFLSGNHEFGFAAFLGLLEVKNHLSKPSGTGCPDLVHGSAATASASASESASASASDDAGCTDFSWTVPKDYPKNELYNGPGSQSMHYRGRRWGAGNSATFRSYGVAPGDREALLKAVPDSHKAFLQSLQWVHETPGYIFVHAGLKSSRSGLRDTIDEQLDMLRNKRIIPNPEQLYGRTSSVFELGTELLKRDVCVVSGHWSTVEFSPRRVVYDQSGGFEGTILGAVLLPAMIVLEHTGNVYALPDEIRKRVFD